MRAWAFRSLLPRGRKSVHAVLPLGRCAATAGWLRDVYRLLFELGRLSTRSRQSLTSELTGASHCVSGSNNRLARISQALGFSEFVVKRILFTFWGEPQIFVRILGDKTLTFCLLHEDVKRQSRDPRALKQSRVPHEVASV